MNTTDIVNNEMMARWLIEVSSQEYNGKLNRVVRKLEGC